MHAFARSFLHFVVSCTLFSPALCYSAFMSASGFAGCRTVEVTVTVFCSFASRRCPIETVDA